jgi:hypothetical protein
MTEVKHFLETLYLQLAGSRETILLTHMRIPQDFRPKLGE